MLLTSVSVASYCAPGDASSRAPRCNRAYMAGRIASPKGRTMKPLLISALLLAATPAAAAARTENAVLAGGCFWGMESVFEHVKGVTDVVSGYAGGSARDAHYDAAESGHAEAVRITYDPARITYAQLLQ